MDPVRFLSNPSSGELGIRVASTLRRAGARVTLVLGPTSLPSPKHISTVRVISAQDMHKAVMRHIKSAHAFVATAAVCDWRFARPSRRKKKKGSRQTERVTLVRTPDILASVGQLKRKMKDLKLIGFALETNDLEKNAAAKLRAKNLDLIIANDPRSFGPSKVRSIWLEPAGRRTLVRRFPPMTKTVLASRIAGWMNQSFRRGTK